MKHVGVRSDPKDIASQEQLGAYTPVVISGTAGQTAFTVPGGYTPDRVFVFINGVLCTEFTATDGTTVTLGSGLDSDNDEVVIVPMGTGPGTNAVNYVGATQPVYTTAASISQALPACDAGDLLLATVMHRSALTIPDGWAQVAQSSVTSSPTTQYTTVLSKVAVAADSAGTITLAQAASGRIAATVAAFSGTVKTPIVQQSATASDTTTALGSPLPGAPITASGNSQKMMVVAQTVITVSTAVATTYTPPSGFNAQTVSSSSTTDATRECVGYKTVSAETFTGAFGITATGVAAGTVANSASVSLVLA